MHARAKNVIKCDAGSKKGKLLCCECIFNQIKASLTDIQPESHKNVQKTHFGKKLWESMG